MQIHCDKDLSKACGTQTHFSNSSLETGTRKMYVGLNICDSWHTLDSQDFRGSVVSPFLTNQTEIHP